MRTPKLMPKPPSLNDYAGPIRLVFEKIAALYHDQPAEWFKARKEILALLDPDVCAEVIETSKRVEADETILPGV